MKKHRKVLLVGIAVIMFGFLTPADPARAELKKCTGTHGEILFTDRKCPPEYSVERAELPSKNVTEDSHNPYICRFAGILSIFEIEDALSTARSSVESKKDPLVLWEDCLLRLEERKRTFEEERGGLNSMPNLPEEFEPPICRGGSVSTDRIVYRGRFDVYYKNLSKSDCKGIRVICTYQVGVREPYTISKEVRYERRVAAGENVKIGTVYSDIDINWSRCRTKKQSDTSWPVAD